MSSQAPPTAPAGLAVPPTRQAPPAPLARMVGGLLLSCLGVALALVGSFLLPLTVSGMRLPLSVALAAGGNLAAGLLGGRGIGTRIGAAVPGLSWLVVVVLLGRRTSEGDLVVVGDLVGLSFILAGMLGTVLAVAMSGWSPVADPVRDDGTRLATHDTADRPEERP